MVLLKDINKSNWIDCILLTTNKDNSHSIFEEFVASNAFSLAQSKIEENWITKAIYVEELLVGFTMYGFNDELSKFEISRLMIDHKYQKKGYGKLALTLIIEEMKKMKNCSEINLTFDPTNTIAMRLYESFGFTNTGQYIQYNVKEIIYRLKV